MRFSHAYILSDIVGVLIEVQTVEQGDRRSCILQVSSVGRHVVLHVPVSNQISSLPKQLCALGGGRARSAISLRYG